MPARCTLGHKRCGAPFAPHGHADAHRIGLRSTELRLRYHSDEKPRPGCGSARFLLDAHAAMANPRPRSAVCAVAGGIVCQILTDLRAPRQIVKCRNLTASQEFDGQIPSPPLSASAVKFRCRLGPLRARCNVACTQNESRCSRAHRALPVSSPAHGVAGPSCQSRPPSGSSPPRPTGASCMTTGGCRATIVNEAHEVMTCGMPGDARSLRLHENTCSAHSAHGGECAECVTSWPLQEL